MDIQALLERESIATTQVDTYQVDVVPAILFNRFERLTNETPRLRRFHGAKLYY